MRFVSGSNKNIMSKSILDVGVESAMQSVFWDEKSFKDRGGVYEWSKDELGQGGSGCNGGSAGDKSLEW